MSIFTYHKLNIDDKTTNKAETQPLPFQNPDRLIQRLFISGKINWFSWWLVCLSFELKHSPLGQSYFILRNILNY